MNKSSSTGRLNEVKLKKNYSLSVSTDIFKNLYGQESGGLLKLMSKKIKHDKDKVVKTRKMVK